MENKEEKLDTEYTDEPICPHCGYVHEDSWEIVGINGTNGDEDGDLYCSSCSELFNWSRHISISWSTYKPKKEIR